MSLYCCVYVLVLRCGAAACSCEYSACLRWAQTRVGAQQPSQTSLGIPSVQATLASRSGNWPRLTLPG